MIRRPLWRRASCLLTMSTIVRIDDQDIAVLQPDELEVRWPAGLAIAH